MSIGYGPKWQFYSCDGLYLIVGIYVVSIMQEPKRSFLLRYRYHVIDVDWDMLYYRCCIWVELPVQRRLCPIFVGDVGSPDIHECFLGLTGSQRTPGIGVSQLSIKA